MMNDQDAMIIEITHSNQFIPGHEMAERSGFPFMELCETSLIQSGWDKDQAYIPSAEKKVLCIGGANVDRKIQSVKDLEFGTSNPAKSTMSCGGVARNIAEDLGRLGLKTSLLACIGADKEGEWLLRQTKKFVDVTPTEMIQGKSTGTYTAVLDTEGEMAIALSEMAIYDQVEEQFIERNWQYVQFAKMILLDTNFPKDVIGQVIQRGKNEKIPICIVTVSATKVEKLPEVLEGVTWLIANQKDAEALSKLKINSDGDFFKAAEAILKKGVEKVIIKRADKGLVYFTNNGEAGVVLPPGIPIIDVTGAGDSLVAGILFGYLKDLCTEDACKIGISCSMITLQSNETVSPALNQQKLLETFRTYFSKGVTQRCLKNT